MNSPEETAKEIVEKFLAKTDSIAEWVPNYKYCRFLAQHCAIVCIEEILQAIDPSEHEGNKLAHWNSVLECVKKM